MASTVKANHPMPKIKSIILRLLGHIRREEGLLFHVEPNEKAAL
ncbi:Hypothetical protein LCAKO_3195 [Lacticaseibacillus paracasei subsp. paracasei]|uniref:Uncharacterized protein n=1 Tax=Lacticaseibacillus paracasei subsp. paracasei TaxID=47714 RepID=A0AAP9KWX7_LACPA|nr:hypothetical protein LCALC10_2751 [Lacticaseibacillus paracasei]QGV19681.1 Hypothetical protein LCAKO_3195 [Lacticaseibacillus paracasei subsp. paracasei]